MYILQKCTMNTNRMILHLEEPGDVAARELVHAADAEQLHEPARVRLQHLAEHAARDLQQRLHRHHGHVVAE